MEPKRKQGEGRTGQESGLAASAGERRVPGKRGTDLLTKAGVGCMGLDPGSEADGSKRTTCPF